MNPPKIVAIDGAAGSGKSTLGRGLALALGLPYINTGLMYRHLTLVALRTATSTEDPAALAALLDDISFSLSDGTPPELLIQGVPPDPALQSDEVEGEVSHVARHPGVRARMRARQRALGELRGAVMEGRDIGSVVFPDAPLKLYLTADPVARATRRAGERAADHAEVEASLHTRDAKDSAVTPFEPPPGSVKVDTASLDVDATLAAAIELVREHAPGLLR